MTKVSLRSFSWKCSASAVSKVTSLVTSQHCSCRSQGGSSEGRLWRRTKRPPTRPHRSSQPPLQETHTDDSTSPSSTTWSQLAQGPRSLPQESEWEHETGTRIHIWVYIMKAEQKKLRCQSVFECNNGVLKTVYLKLELVTCSAELLSPPSDNESIYNITIVDDLNHKMYQR